MDTALKGIILAVITDESGKLQAGNCPVFLVQNRAEQERLGLLIARILGGYVHDLENGVLIITRH